jgi:Winged helix-turn helix
MKVYGITHLTRRQVITLYYHGWEKVSISRLLKVSRRTVDTWLRRFETEHFAGLMGKSRPPKAPAHKIWLRLGRYIGEWGVAFDRCGVFTPGFPCSPPA